VAHARARFPDQAPQAGLARRLFLKVADRPVPPLEAPMSTNVKTASIESETSGQVFREILVPTDLSDPGDGALEQAAILAARLGGRLTLYHALEFPDHEYGHWAFGERPCVWDEQERLARDHLADCAEGLAVPHETVVERSASPVRALLARVSATAPDLTVMATQGRGAVAHLLLGSVAEQVVLCTQGPVLCVRGSTPIDRLLAGRIVLDSDFSEASRPALRLATVLARTFGGELVVLHAGGAPLPERVRPDDGEPWRPYAAAEGWLAPLPADVRVRVVVDTAPALKAVLRLASDERAGLVITSRTAGAGGDAARVVRHAHCPVLVV
jgi:nucleotide-binding universal stress UspA family protein